MLTAMAEALVKAGHVEKKKAEEVIRTQQVNEELGRDRKEKQRKKELRHKLKKVVELAERGTNRSTIAWHIEDLRERYGDIFDEIAVEEAHHLRLGDLLKR